MSGLLKYQEIQNYLLQELSSGRFSVGDKFYSETEIKNHFKVTQITVRQACVPLIEQGLLHKQRGNGTFVTSLPSQPVRLKIVRRCIIAAMISEVGLENNLKIAKLLLALHRSAVAAGYSLMLMHEDLSTLSDMGTNGVIILNLQKPEMISKLAALKMPTVSLYETGVAEFPSLLANAGDMTGQVIHAFAKTGHKRLLVFGYGEDARKVKLDSSALWRAGAKEKGLEYLEEISSDEKVAEQNLSQLLSSDKRPDAVFVANHWCLPVLQRVMHQQKLRYPQDISIIVHGTNAQEVLATPPYSYIDYNVDEVAESLVDLLRKRIRGDRVKPEEQPLRHYKLFCTDSICDRTKK